MPAKLRMRVLVLIATWSAHAICERSEFFWRSRNKGRAAILAAFRRRGCPPKVLASRKIFGL